MMGTVRVSQRMTVLKVEAAPNTLFLTVPKLLCRRLPVVVLQDGTVGTVMVAVLLTAAGLFSLKYWWILGLKMSSWSRV